MARRRSREALRTGAEIFHALRGILKGRGQSTGVGDEGGFAPNLKSNREAVEVVLEAISKGGLEGRAATSSSRSTWPRANSGLAAAATCSRSPANPSARQRRWSSSTTDWVRQYPIISIEDGIAEGDWDGWKLLTQALGDRVQLVGDDVFVTNPEILKRGIADKVANALLVKLNQIGTVTETLDAVGMARDAGYATIISHRSGETEDTTIADMAVGTAAGQIKTGSASRTDRVVQIQPAASHRRGAWCSAVYAGVAPFERLPLADGLTLHSPRGRSAHGSSVPSVSCAVKEHSTMYKLVLLRHGESTWNKENRFTGWTDVDLSDRGREEAAEAGRLLKEGGYAFDQAYVSVLKRAIRTLWITLDGLDQMWIPVEKSWRLNERHYGALQGLNKAETAAKHGDAQVLIWRRSYDIPPPPLAADDERHPSRDARYAGLAPATFR